LFGSGINVLNIVEPTLNYKLQHERPVAVVGNHDFESGKIAEIQNALEGVGMQNLDGDATEILGVGFAGVCPRVGFTQSTFGSANVDCVHPTLRWARTNNTGCSYPRM
jgi:hypothetical protein